MGQFEKGRGVCAREIPRPLAENAGLRDDATLKIFKLTHYLIQISTSP